MLVFPQLSTGTPVQYPLTKKSARRCVQSVMEDGSVVTLVDRGSAYLQWRLAFQGLSDDEVQSLSSFFSATRGNLLPFVFLDPTANLLRWTEDILNGAWDKGGLAISPTVTDAFGSSRGSRVTNYSLTTQTLAQWTPIPGLAQTCFSVYLRATNPTAVSLMRTAGSYSQASTVNLVNEWGRFSISSSFPDADVASCFGLHIPSGGAVEVFGMQVDAQVYPSPYIASTGNISNVHLNARFDMKQLDVITTGPNQNACVVYVRSNLPAGE